MSEKLCELGRIDDNPFQTRQVYDPAGIAELAADIYAQGLLQPPVGRQVGERIQLAFGHRRLRAYRHIVTEIDRLGWGAMPVNVQYLSDEQMALHAWSENAKRKDLTPIEEALAMQRMLAQFGWGQTELGTKLGVDRSTVANKLRLLKLPAEVQARVLSRELSERQAAALLPLYELPAGTLAAYEKAAFVYTRPSGLVVEAADMPSDRLRARVEDVVEKATRALNVPWYDTDFDDRYMRAPNCAMCAERVTRKQGSRCPHVNCFERKAAAWRVLRLGLATTATGIAAAPEELPYGDYKALTNVPQPDQVVARGCANLRLRWVGADTATVTRVRVEAYPDVEVICVHGKDGRCTCGSAAKAAATRADPDIQEARAAEKRIEAEIVKPARAAVLAGLVGGDVGVWRDLATTVVYSLRLREGADLAEIQAAVAKGLAERQVYMRDKTDYGQAKEGYAARLKNLGLAVPWAVSPLEDAQRRYERVARWVAQGGFWRFDYEIGLDAIAGNIVNLETLAAEVAQLADADDLRRQVESLRLTLQRLAPLAAEVNALRGAPSWRYGNLRNRCELLLSREVGGLEHDQALASATAPELRYALLFADSLTRVQALSGRLAELVEAG